MISRITRSFFFRLCVGCGILYLLSLSINFGESVGLIKSASKTSLALCLLVIGLIRIFLALRWKYILNYDKIAYNFGKILSITYISTSLGQIMPGGIGPDVLRVYQLKKDNINTVDTASSIIYDRAIGVFSMLVLAFCGSLIATFIGSDIKIPLLLLASIILICIGFAIMRYMSRFNYSFRFRLFNKLLNLIQVLMDSLTDFNKLKQLFLPLFAMSLCVQMLRCLLFFMIYDSLGQTINFIYFAIFIPIVLGVSVLPISIGGLGVREGMLAFFFASMHLKPEISVSAGIMFQLLQIIFSLPGIFYWMYNKENTEKQVDESE